MGVVVSVVVDGAPVGGDVVVTGGKVVGGWPVGGQESGVNFKKPNAPPKASLSAKTITSQELGSTAKYSPALLLALSP